MDIVTPMMFVKSAPYKSIPGESYMNKRQLIHFETLLSTWRMSLQRNIKQSFSNLKKTSIKHADESDKASQEAELRVALQTRARKRALIRDIEDALLRLKSKNFGYCDNCGLEIGLRRLEAQLTTRHCIDCKTKSELAERQHIWRKE